MEVDHTYPWSLPRSLIILIGVAAALVAALGMREFNKIIGPVFLALVLSIAVHPVRRFSDRRHWPAWLGVILSLIAVYGIVFLRSWSLQASSSRHSSRTMRHNSRRYCSRPAKRSSRSG